MRVKVISLPYIFQVLYVFCFTRPRYQVSVHRTIGPLVLIITSAVHSLKFKKKLETRPILLCSFATVKYECE